MAKTDKTIKVEQIGSPIRRQHAQRATLIGLGLNKIGRARDAAGYAAVRGMIAKVKHLVRVVGRDVSRSESSGDEAQRNRRQRRRAQEAHARRPRHRLGQGQDRRARRQGPDRALRRAHQGLRRRPDAAASAPAEARLQQHLRAATSTRSISAGCRRRSTPASSTPGAPIDADGAGQGRRAAPRQGRRAAARQRRIQGQARLRGAAAPRSRRVAAVEKAGGSVKILAKPAKNAKGEPAQEASLPGRARRSHGRWSDLTQPSTR